jgi:hypothetical protein
MMDRIRKIITVIAIPACIVLLACGNKGKQTEPMIIDSRTTAEEPQVDTVATFVQAEPPKEVENSSFHSSSSSSSSSTIKSTKYDNMRGFDPASEDDMEDNGMSRYMENNDDEGWD